MFCHKCGSQVAEGSAFCIKCGAKLKADDVVRNTASPEPAVRMRQQTDGPREEIPQKRKLKKLPFILGAAALVTAAVIVIALNWEGDIDYIATVKAHKPFDKSQGLPYTYGEVFDQYIKSPDWQERENGNVNYVDISGKVKGTEEELAVTIKVTPDADDPDIAVIDPESVTIGGEESPTQNDAVLFLLSMFSAYEEGYGDLSGLLSETGQMGAQEDLNLSETYTNDAEGISFRYPGEWTFNDMAEYGANDASGFSLICMISNASPNSQITVSKNSNPWLVENVFSDNNRFLESFGYDADAFSGLETAMGQIGETPARLVDYVMDEKIAHRACIYVNGSTLYKVEFTCNKEEIEAQGRLFDAMIDSYAVSAVEITDQLLFCGIPVQNIIGMSVDEVIAAFGEPDDYTENSYMGYVNGDEGWMNFDFMYDNRVTGFSANPENFTYNGQSLDKDFDSVVNILGDTYISQGGTEYFWEAAWHFEGCQISIRFPTYPSELGEDTVVDISVYMIG